jgi:hypothetical protein
MGASMRRKISREEAYQRAVAAGADFKRDVFQQPLSVMGEMHELANKSGYRKPKNANGSTGRYFFEHLKKRL